MIREHKNARVAHSAPEPLATVDAPHAAPAAPSEPALRVRLIGKSNGVGLSRDFELLSRALTASGCEVSVHGCERRERKARRGVLTRLAARLRWHARAALETRRSRRWDLNLMLEHVWPQFLHQAHCNVLVPNPEWFDRRDVAFLGEIDRVWAKTVLAAELFGARGCVISPIGFDSEDRLLPAVARERAFLHLAGRSPLKGTRRLLELWRRHPEWPRLTLVQDEPESDRGGVVGAGNIALLRGYVEEEELRRLQNAHRFHLCVSEAEGWGHYIAEAMGVAAVTFASDAAPMNELINAERGVLVAAPLAERHNLARLARFDERSLEAQIARVLQLPQIELETLGAAARTWFLANKQGFTARVQAALSEVQRLLRAAHAEAGAAR